VRRPRPEGNKIATCPTDRVFTARLSRAAVCPEWEHVESMTWVLSGPATAICEDRFWR